MLGWTPAARVRRQAPILVVLVLTLISVGAQGAYAHSLLERSEPAAGSVLSADSQPGHVSLWFSEPVNVAFNAISVLDVDNRRVDGLDPHMSPTDTTRIDASLARLAQGAYVVRWQATSADNHPLVATPHSASPFCITQACGYDEITPAITQSSLI